MSTPITTWAQHERASVEKWNKNETEKIIKFLAIEAIEKLANNQQSAPETAQELDNIYRPRLSTSQIFGLGGLWGIFSSATQWYGGEASQRLADLMIAIRKLPDVLHPTSRVVKDGGFVIWKDIPSWGWIFAEHGVGFNLPELDYPNILDEETYSEWHKQAPGLLNATACAAHLMKDEWYRGGMQRHANDMLEMGIEDPYDSSREMPHEWKMYLPPAVTWIMIAGKQLHGLCFHKWENDLEAEKIWTFRFTPIRWGMWKQRLRELAQQEEIDTYYRDLATQAADEIIGLERDDQG